MAFIDWDDSLSVGVKELDDQHKYEAGLLNRFHEAKGDEAIKIFDELFEHTKLHFDTEETYFRTFNYEKADEHIAAHDNFLKTALKFKAQVDSGGGLSEKDQEVIKGWLANHIKSMDQDYTGCFHDHGLD